MKLHVIQADFGDSLILENEEQDSPAFILIDGGPTSTYANHLKYALNEIVTDDRHLNLVVLTHIDNDHIRGIMKFLEDLKLKKLKRSRYLHIDNIWHNTFKQNIGISSEIAPKVLTLAEKAEWKGLLYELPDETVRGISQGEHTSKLASDLGIPVNAGFKDDLILFENAPTPWVMGNLKIWVIGPNQHNLERLQREWLIWLEEKVSKPVTRAAEKDTSIPNLSSIMLLVEADGRQILMTGDGISQDILDGLNLLGKLDSSGKIHVDIIKLPHHGSKRNVSEEFFENVRADIYVVSANGQNNNPEFETLEWIVTSAKRQQRTIQILATNETGTTESLLKKYDQHAFGYTLSYMQASQHYVTV